jgi:hypothetical protein
MKYFIKSTHKLPIFFSAWRLGIALVGFITMMALPQTARAQSLTTVFTGGNNNSIGGGVFFDLNVTSGIIINSLSTNVSNAAGTSIAGSSVNLEIWTRSGTATGFQSAATGWTLVSTGSAIAAATNLPTVFDVSDFNLGSGVTGIAIRNVDYSARYTNGTGSNQVYSNADLTISTGSATNTFLAGGGAFSPRVWNGTISYTVAPEPGTLVLFALGGVGALIKKRRKSE